MEKPRSRGWELLKSALAGQDQAFELLMAHHDRLLHYLVYKHRPSILGYSDVQDVVDETWYQVLLRAHRGEWKEDVKFSSWLCGVCLNVLKSRAFSPQPSLGTSGGDCEWDPLAAVATDGGEVAEAVAEAEVLDALRECVAERTERERQLYEMLYVEGTTKTEAARRLGCSEAFVRQKLLPKLLDALKRCLERKGHGDVP